MRGVLELVEDRPLDLVEDPVDRAWSPPSASPAGRSSRRTNTAALVDDERRHAPHVVARDERRVLLLDRRQRAPAVDLGPHGIGVDAGGGEDLGEHVAVAQVAGRRRGGARTTRGGRRGSARAACHGPRSPTWRASRPRVARRAVPRRRVRPRRRGSGRVRTAGTSRPSRRRPRSAGDHVVVDDAGVRAAVVEGEGERAGHRRHSTSRGRQRIPSRRSRPRRATGARARPRRPHPATTSEAWWMRT